MRVHKCPAFFLSGLTKMENLKKFLLKIETKRMRIALIIQRLLLGAKNGGVIGIFMRGTKKYKIVKCFRHFGAIIILLWLISIVRFPYSFDELQVLSNKNFESVSNSVLTLVECKSTESKSSIDFLLTDGKQYYIITAKRFFIWNRYDLSQLMPFSEGTSYSYTDCFTKVNVIQSGNKLCLDEERYVQPYILSFLFLCVVLILNILGDKSTPEE